MAFKLPRRGFLPLLFLVMLVPLATKARASQIRAMSAVHNSPVGSWKTVDDRTGKAKSVVTIREWQGVLYGRIEELFDPPVPHPLCIRCTGTFKNKPVLGLQILWGMRKDGNQWSGGYVLDPESGNVYHCTISLEDRGKVLRVHGYVGLSIFGRTERWKRVENGTAKKASAQPIACQTLCQGATTRAQQAELRPHAPQPCFHPGNHRSKCRRDLRIAHICYVCAAIHQDLVDLRMEGALHLAHGTTEADGHAVLGCPGNREAVTGQPVHDSRDIRQRQPEACACLGCIKPVVKFRRG